MAAWLSSWLMLANKVKNFNRIRKTQKSNKKRNRRIHLILRVLTLQQNFRKNTKHSRNSGRQVWASPRRLLRVIGSRIVITISRRLLINLRRNKSRTSPTSKRRLKSTIDIDEPKQQTSQTQLVYYLRQMILMVKSMRVIHMSCLVYFLIFSCNDIFFIC